MTVICAILVDSKETTTFRQSLLSLQKQTRRPEHTLLYTERQLSPEEEAQLKRDFAAIGLCLCHRNAASGYREGFDTAFRSLNADYVWILDTDTEAAPDALQQILDRPDAPGTIRTGLLKAAVRGDELSRPLAVESAENLFSPWKNHLKTSDLPPSPEIPVRGAWLGALYPRAAWKKIGSPTADTFLQNNNDEYPWKARRADFRFSVIPAAVLYHPSFAAELIHFKIGGRSFFYEIGLPPDLQYYKIRNWAWILRLRHPKKPHIRLALCGCYIILAINAMLKSGELHPRRVYNLFRALHNGFYGKLRPF